MADTDSTGALRVVDHGPHAWFLFEDGDDLYFDSRYAYSTSFDDSVLIKLSAAEREAYGEQGRDYLDRLQQEIDASSPYAAGSRYANRDLYRRDGGASLHDATGAAVSTWKTDHT